MNLELVGALNELEKERGIPKEIVFDAIEAALVSAYKRNNSSVQSVRVAHSEKTGDFRLFAEKTVVDEVEDEANEISLEDAREIRSDSQMGEIVDVDVTPNEFGRIAAQTAKQVVIQRIREAERSLIYEEFSNREGDIVTGIVQRIENRHALVDLGKVEAVLPVTEQIPRENYFPGLRVKVYVTEVRKTTKGPQVIVSRTHPGLLARLFELEVPEIHDGVVELKAVAREAGNRSKIAVHSVNPHVDPVGACVGPRGMRVQTIVSELKGERVDVVQWDSDPEVFIGNALSPARVIRVQADDYEKSARAVVPDHQLSLAIGKEGQNARLAARLTGWKIDIKSESQMRELIALEAFRPAPPKPEPAPELTAEAEPTVDDILSEALDELIPSELLPDEPALPAAEETAQADSAGVDVPLEVEALDEEEEEDAEAEPVAPSKAKRKKAVKRVELKEVLEEVEVLDEEPLPSLFAEEGESEGEGDGDADAIDPAESKAPAGNPRSKAGSKAAPEAAADGKRDKKKNDEDREANVKGKVVLKDLSELAKVIEKLDDDA